MGCVEGAGTGNGTQGQTTVAPASVRAGSGREVEAPEVFQVTDSGLWDGRPSLGGIWVASPDVTDPERVVIVNPATGKSVNGALFRRERDNPGPPLQVSSDAAEALGMLAGQPTSLRVTALRKPAEAVPAPDTAATAVAAATPTDAATEAAAADSASGDTAAAETAALAAAALAATGSATEAAQDSAATPVAAAEGAVDAAATEAPKPKTWKERRAEAKARREAEKAAKAAAAAEAAAAVAAADGTEGAAGAVGETAATAENAAVAAVETAPLDARSPDVAAAADAAATTEGQPAPEPKKTRRQLREEKKAAAEAAEAAAAAEATAAAAEPATATSSAEPAAGRTIQIASYSKEANATRAVETLAKIGITGQISKTEKDGKSVWSVVTRGDDAQLTAIKGAGFADAFFLQ
jgi:predicted HNH restriction endonuclease